MHCAAIGMHHGFSYGVSSNSHITSNIYIYMAIEVGSQHLHGGSRMANPVMQGRATTAMPWYL